MEGGFEKRIFQNYVRASGVRPEAHNSSIGRFRLTKSDAGVLRRDKLHFGRKKCYLLSKRFFREIRNSAYFLLRHPNGGQQVHGRN